MRAMERFNPLFKMAASLIAAVILSFNHSVIVNLAVFSVSMLLIIFLSRVSKLSLIKLLLPISIVLAALFMTGYKNADQSLITNFATGTHHLGNLENMTPVYLGLQLCTRVMGYVGLGLLFAMTTPAEDLILSLMHQAHVKPKFAYGILAAFHLIPEIARELEDAKLAYKVRGINVGRLSLKPFFAAMVNCIRWSENLAMAMESKGFDGDGARTFDRTLRVHFYDIIYAVILPALVLAGTLLVKY